MRGGHGFVKQIFIKSKNMRFGKLTYVNLKIYLFELKKYCQLNVFNHIYAYTNNFFSHYAKSVILLISFYHLLLQSLSYIQNFKQLLNILNIVFILT